MAIGQYLRETRAELKHVAWPTRTQTVVFTTLVIGLSIAAAVYLGVFDYIFSEGVGQLLDISPAPQTNPVSIEQATSTQFQIPTSTPTN